MFLRPPMKMAFGKPLKGKATPTPSGGEAACPLLKEAGLDKSPYSHGISILRGGISEFHQRCKLPKWSKQSMKIHEILQSE